MGYVYYNPNPGNKFVGDCVVRALSIVLNSSWQDTYIGLCTLGALMYDMPNSNAVWAEYLKSRGFYRGVIPDTCPYCYTVLDFVEEHPTGTFVLGTGSHVIAVIDGNYFDTGDTGNEVPIYYWRKGDDSK